MQDQEIPPEAEEGEIGEGEDVVLLTVAGSPPDATASNKADFTAHPWTTAIAPTRMVGAVMAGQPARGAPDLRFPIRKWIPSRCPIAPIALLAFSPSLTTCSFRRRFRKPDASST